MKWDEIHDQSRVVVDKAIENLLAEGKEVEKKENDIVEKLRDVEYVGKKLEKRKRYSGKDAFLRLKTSNGKEKTFASGNVDGKCSVCGCCLCNLVAVETNRSVVAENEYDCKAGKYFSGGDESNIGESGRGTSCVRKRVS